MLVNNKNNIVMTKEEFDKMMELTFGDKVINIPSDQPIIKLK
jgi:hypothetical protein